MFVSPNDRQFQEISLDGFCVKSQKADNCVGLDGKVVLVENIVQREDGSIFVVYRIFCEVSDFFTYPLKSSSLKIYVVSKLSSTFESLPLSLITCKYVLMSHRNKLVAVPLRHSD